MCFVHSWNPCVSTRGSCQPVVACCGGRDPHRSSHTPFLERNVHINMWISCRSNAKANPYARLLIKSSFQCSQVTYTMSHEFGMKSQPIVNSHCSQLQISLWRQKYEKVNKLQKQSVFLKLKHRWFMQTVQSWNKTPDHNKEMIKSESGTIC